MVVLSLHIQIESHHSGTRRHRCRSTTCSCSSRLAASSHQSFTGVAMQAAGTSRARSDDERRRHRRISLAAHQPQARSAASTQQARPLHGRPGGRRRGDAHRSCRELRTRAPTSGMSRKNVYQNVYSMCILSRVPGGSATVAGAHESTTLCNAYMIQYINK